MDRLNRYKALAKLQKFLEEVICTFNFLVIVNKINVKDFRRLFNAIRKGVIYYIFTRNIFKIIFNFI